MITSKRLKNGKIVYIVKAKLIFKKNGKTKKYTLSQRVDSPTNIRTAWDITRTTLNSLLRQTSPSDWLFRKAEWFNGAVDSILPVDKDYHPMTFEDYKFVLEDINGYWDNRYNGIRYLQDENAIKVSHLALGTYYLKPKDDDMLRIEIPKTVLAEALIYALK